jgi:hypothetical protein
MRYFRDLILYNFFEYYRINAKIKFRIRLVYTNWLPVRKVGYPYFEAKIHRFSERLLTKYDWRK